MLPYLTGNAVIGSQSREEKKNRSRLTAFFIKELPPRGQSDALAKEQAKEIFHNPCYHAAALGKMRSLNHAPH